MNRHAERRPLAERLDAGIEERRVHDECGAMHDAGVVQAANRVVDGRAQPEVVTRDD